MALHFAEMKEIPLTQGYVALVDVDDYDFLMQWKWCAMVTKSGNVYAARRSPMVNGKQKKTLMHRVVMNAPPDKFVDHRDGNTLNNCRSNLRLCTNAENLRNQGKNKNNTSGFCGVYRNGKGFQAQIRLNGKLLHMGTYSTPEEAARAYDIGAIKYHGEFARLNFPEHEPV